MLVIGQLCSDKIEDLGTPNQFHMELDTNTSGDVIVIKRIYQLCQGFSKTFQFWLWLLGFLISAVDMYLFSLYTITYLIVHSSKDSGGKYKVHTELKGHRVSQTSRIFSILY